MPTGGRETVLVYRDRIVPRSEAEFLRRNYIGFEKLAPVWVGCHTGDGLAALGARPLILGRRGWRGALDRALFKQLGMVPPEPDLAALKPRIIHAHFGRGGALALPLARWLGIPLVVSFHGGDATKETHYRPRLVPTIFQRRFEDLKREAALFICVSDFIRDRLIARGFPPDKLRVIRYGVEIGDAPPAAPARARPVVLFVGRFVEKKGVPDLIAALRLLQDEGADIALVLVGDGPMAAAWKKQARGLRNVEFTGWLPQDAVRRRMRDALALAAPSVTAEGGDAEGLPNVVLEAMAEGTPVIGTAHAGIAEAVEHEKTGLIVPPGDARALAAAIKRLAGDPKSRAAMGENARRAAAGRFGATAQSKLLERTLLSVLGRG